MGEDADNNPVAPADVLEDCTMGTEEAEARPIWKPALKEAGWAFAAAAAPIVPSSVTGAAELLSASSPMPC